METFPPDVSETTTTPGCPPPPPLPDLCDATRKCWILCTVIIHPVSEARRSTVYRSRFKPLCIIKMPLATHSSCKLFHVSHLLSNISFWQSSVGSPQKSPNKVFCAETPFFSPPPPLLAFPLSALAAPHFSKSACSIKTTPNKEL